MRICLVLGAGASLAQAERFRPQRGAEKRQPPLDRTFWKKVKALDITLTPALRSYIRTLTGQDANFERLADSRMEEFFKDVYFDFRDHDDRPTRTAYTDLVNIYNRVLRETTSWLCDDGHRRGPIGNLLASAAGVADEVDVVTFNHDLLIENEIEKRARLRERWCLDHGYGAFGETMSRLHFEGDAPEFTYHNDDCDHSRPIRIYKLHGSLNWIIRINGRQPTVKDLTGEGRFRGAFLIPRRTPIETQLQHPGKGRGRKRWYTWPVVIPPIYAKQTMLAHVRDSWDDARRAVEHADRLVFFGYSLPQVDIEAEKLFQRGLNTNTKLEWVDVVDTDPQMASRYAGIVGKKSIRWQADIARFVAQRPFALP